VRAVLMALVAALLMLTVAPTTALFCTSETVPLIFALVSCALSVVNESNRRSGNASVRTRMALLARDLAKRWLKWTSEK
jgi:hypothetical protein